VPPISIRSTSSKDINGLSSKGASARNPIKGWEGIGIKPENDSGSLQRPQTSGALAGINN